jgi:hypothetical protein
MVPSLGSRGLKLSAITGARTLKSQLDVPFEGEQP